MMSANMGGWASQASSYATRAFGMASRPVGFGGRSVISNNYRKSRAGLITAKMMRDDNMGMPVVSRDDGEGNDDNGSDILMSKEE